MWPCSEDWRKKRKEEEEKIKINKQNLLDVPKNLKTTRDNTSEPADFNIHLHMQQTASSQLFSVDYNP